MKVRVKRKVMKMRTMVSTVGRREKVVKMIPKMPKITSNPLPNLPLVKSSTPNSLMNNHNLISWDNVG